MPNAAPHISAFEAIRHTNDTGGKYWSARDLAPVLDDPRWQKIRPVIDQAMQACDNSGYLALDHMVGIRNAIRNVCQTGLWYPPT